MVERAPHLRPGGQALDVRGPALQVAERMGVLAPIRDRSTKLAGMPNFLGLDRWQVIHEHGNVFGCVLGVRADTAAKTYIIFATDEPLDYDYRDITAQKQWVAQRVAGAGWEFPRTSRVGRDAGYSISPATGQGTTVAMVGAYVPAGELAADRTDLLAGIGLLRKQPYCFQGSI